MLTYQVRPRVFRVHDGTQLPFPNKVMLELRFSPDAAFGNQGARGRTWRQSTPGGVFFDANTGHFTIDPKASLEKLDVTVEHENMLFEARGNVIRISTDCQSNQQLTELVESLYYGLPLMLTVEFEDPVVIDRVTGRVGETNFAWELAQWKAPIILSNQDRQERRVARGWKLMEVVAQSGNRRLLAALHYFYTACRLRRAGHTPWEFMSEIILNYCKVLEALFPPSGDGKTRDAVREGLGRLGYKRDEIERDFIPAMLLRNELDVGHVDLTLFTRSQLRTLQTYVETTERLCCEMLKLMLSKVEKGNYELPAYDRPTAPPAVAGIIERMAETMSNT